MRRSTILILAVAFTLPIVAAYAQRGNRGDTKTGRRGWQWQAGQNLEEEAMKEFQRDLERLSDEEWKGEALAWIEFRTFDGGGGIEVTDSFRVGDLTSDGAVDIEAAGGVDSDAEEWNIRFREKPPREFALVLTDVNETRIDCPLRQTVEKEGRALGIFQHRGVILCMPRFGERAS